LVLDLSGRKVLGKRENLNHSTLDISELPFGNYFIKVTDGEKRNLKKFIVS
jgi:hypothetical protein